MPNNPSWLRCETCLWWTSGAELGTPGCNYEVEVVPKNPFSRCSEWTCKRCFQKWYQDESEQVNHLYCPIIARKKPAKDVK